MPSLISTTGFNADYPVAGQDNDSQGFRTNFNVTKVALEQAASEITDLITNTVKVNEDNVLNGSKISEAQMVANTETVHPNDTVTSSQNISWANGHYQTIQVGADIDLTLADWPDSGVMGKMRLQITGDGTSRTIVWKSDVSGSFKTDANWPDPFTVTSSSNPVIVDFWTINNGASIFAQYHGQFS